jgi:phage anti-repressor protein
MSSVAIRSYVKRFVNVSDKFIDEFFAHYDVEQQPGGNLFSIDLDSVSRWLGVVKGNLKATLVRTYVDGIDYVVSKPHVGAYRGRAKLERIMLTPDCFKALCMMSRTPKAAQVRAYYIAVESAFIAYRNDVSAAKDRRIEELERNQQGPLTAPRRKGLLYVIQASRDVPNLSKLGKTVREYDRMQSHNRALADDLIVQFRYETDHVDCVESCAKLVLRGRQYRKRKEVYQVTLPLLKKIIEACGNACSLQITDRGPRPSTTSGGSLGGRLAHVYYAVILKK